MTTAADIVDWQLVAEVIDTAHRLASQILTESDRSLMREIIRSGGFSVTIAARNQ